VAITVDCDCGKTYRLKDEMAGRRVECPACRKVLRVEALVPTAQADPVFDRDRFLLRQKHLAISQKYYVWDDHGAVLLFVERPTHLLRTLGVLFGTIGVVFASVMGVVFLAVLLANVSEVAATIAVVLGGLAGIVATIATAVALSPRRHVHFYRDDSRSEQVLQVLQDQKFVLLTATYTVLDAQGEILARLRKNYLHNIFRKRWYCLAPDDKIICLALEDSIILALLRRVLRDLLFGLLRVNFVIVAADGEHILGEFNRKFTLLDRYVLDLSRDPERTLDRRVALALGVMLDTGERR
jgi:uncharacterized protein YxjI